MVNENVLNTLAELLLQRHAFVTTSMLDKAVADILKRTERKQAHEQFSLSTMIRGLRAMRGEAINPSTAEADVKYVKALTTGSTPGSYLVPTRLTRCIAAITLSASA